MSGRMRRIWLAVVFALTGFQSVHADSLNVAVASNFINPARILAARFSSASGHQINLSAGSTAKLYTQIINGAPFDIFLAANAREPRRLEQQGHAVAATRFTYAIGRLALWSADQHRIKGDCGDILQGLGFQRLAIANPRVAPYGQQARNVLDNLAIYDTVAERLIVGENVGQAFRFVSSKNAQLGIVSLSQIKDPRNPIAGSHCLIAADLHEPLEQQAIVLQRARNKALATAFMQFLASQDARDLIRRYGYIIP